MKMRSVFAFSDRRVIGALALASLMLLALTPDASALPLSPIPPAEQSVPLNLPWAPVVRQQACPCTLWPDQAVPAVAGWADNRAVELGVKFRVTSPGFISGIRFFKSAENVGMHLGNLWSGDAQLLSRATFGDETASGWQRALFSSPIPVSPNITYVASYHTDVGYYASNQDYFATTGYERGPLRALANGEDGPNGVYRYGASGFPSDTYQSSNYWVDPIFTTDGIDVVPPAISGVQVTDITRTGATIRWQTDEASDSRIIFGPTTSYGNDAGDGNLVMTHAVALSDLAPNSGYHVRIGSRDAAGNQAVSGDFTFTTASTPPPPTGQCLPRPNASVATARSGTGRLLVTVRAGKDAATPNNRLLAIRFLPGSNALIDVAGLAGRTGEFTVAIPGRPEQTTFSVARATPGQATTVPFVVIDDCGEFRSFAGGGVGSF
jgi:hypothetical protein